jgi:flotillin
MTTETLIVAGVIVLLVVVTFIGLLSRYRKCASDEILVVFGKAGKKKVVNEKTGKTEEVILPSKIIHGGGTFVMPVIQDWAKMSLKPIQIQVMVEGVSSQMIKVRIPVTLTTGIGTDQVLMQNAASRFLTAKTSEISDQIKDILIGEVRSLMATMTIEEINADRIKFIGKAKENIETELNKVGFSIININNADISDDANYIKNLGQKAATKALAQAQADIAEEKKKGDIQIAETNKQREIAVADAEKERETTVAQTKQEQEVKVAEINQEKAIRLAEAEKNKQAGIAEQKAEQEASIARANTQAESAKAEAESQRIANVAKSASEATSKKAAADAEAEANVAKAKAEADSKKAEAEALKQTRIAQAKQKQEADTQKAINEQEAATAEYESQKRIKAAEADKQAGVAEQKATIEVSKAKGEAAQAQAEAEKVAGTSKVEARMAVAKTEQERQIEVNEAAAKAEEAKLQAEMIVPAQKQKERVTIEAEAIKAKAVLEAEAEAAKILKEAEAKADATKLQLEAEAEGTRKKLLAEAEGKRASLMAEADKVQAIEMAPALAVEKMIESGLTPEMVVQYKTVDQLTGIAEASAQMFEHVHLGQVTVYGNENTAGNFMAKTAENLNPAFDLLRSIPFADTLKSVLGKKELEEKKAETTEFEEVK